MIGCLENGVESCRSSYRTTTGFYGNCGGLTRAAPAWKISTKAKWKSEELRVAAGGFSEDPSSYFHFPLLYFAGALEYTGIGSSNSACKACNNGFNSFSRSLTNFLLVTGWASACFRI